jgi:triacylglycerol lipase
VSFDPKFVIDVMYPAANAAYLIMSLPPEKLSLPAGYTYAGTIDANAQDAAAARAQTDAMQQRIADAAMAESNIFGLVLWNAASSTAIVAFRGSKTLWDWIADIDAIPFAYLPDPSAGLAHMGFQLLYEHVRGSVGAILKSDACPGVKQVIVTGHSLGGALSVLGGLDLATNVLPGVSIDLYTFAGPRTGDPKFAGTFNKVIPNCFRVVNFMDVVPQLPVPPLYEHVGTEELVQGGFKILDVTYAHHLTTYLVGLQKLSKGG